MIYSRNGSFEAMRAEAQSSSGSCSEAEPSRSGSVEQETLQQRRLEDRDAASSNAPHASASCRAAAQRPPEIPTRFPHQTWLGWDWESLAFFSGPFFRGGGFILKVDNEMGLKSGTPRSAATPPIKTLF